MKEFVSEFVCNKFASFRDLLLRNNYFKKHTLTVASTIYACFLKIRIILSKINDTLIDINLFYQL